MPGQQKSKHLKTESGKCFNFRAFFYLIVQNHKSSNREKFVYIVSYTRKYLFNLTIFLQTDNFWCENTKPIFSLLIPTFRYPDLKKHDNFS